MVGAGGEKQCPQCYWPVTETAKFCGECGCPLKPDQRMTAHPKRPGEEEEWDVVEEESKSFEFTVRKESVTGAKSKAKAKAAAPQPGHVTLRGKELMAAIPGMSKEEKKKLHHALQEEEDQETEKRRQLFKNLMKEYSHYDDYEPGPRELFPEEPGRYEEWKARRSHAGYGEGQNSAGSQDALPPQPRPDKPKAVKERELGEFRRLLYDRQVQHGRCIPSTAADWPTEQQNQFRHLFESLRWSANAEGHFARCKLCDLKHVIYYSQGLAWTTSLPLDRVLV